MSIGYTAPWKLYGFKEDPFSELKGPHAVFETAGTRLVQSVIRDAVEEHSLHAIVALAGSGKSVAIAKALRELQRQLPYAKFIAIGPEDPRRLTIASVRTRIIEEAKKSNLGGFAFGRQINTDHVKAALIALHRRFHNGVALLFDNAHDYAPRVLRNIRQLIEDTFSERQHLAGVAWIGWPGLDTIIKSSAFEDIAIRTVIHELPPLTHEEVPEFVIHRIRAAGGDATVIARESLDYLASRGVDSYGWDLKRPAAVLQLCQKAMELGTRAGERKLSPGLFYLADKDKQPLRSIWEEHNQEPSLDEIASRIRFPRGHPQAGQLIRRSEVKRYLDDPGYGNHQTHAMIAAVIRFHALNRTEGLQKCDHLKKTDRRTGVTAAS